MGGSRRPSSTPSSETVRSLRLSALRLGAFPQVPAGDPALEGPADLLARSETTLAAVRSELERLGPWFAEFVGSSLVITLAQQAADEAGEMLRLHVHQLKEPPASVVPLVGGTVRLAGTRLESMLELLPGHVKLAGRIEEKERPLGVRVAAMPPKLRLRYYLGIALGAFLLLSVVAVSVVLVVPGVSQAIGVSSLLHHYAAQYAGIVVVAILFASGLRLILGSIWLRRSIKILPKYEDGRIQEVADGIRQRETEVLDEISPRSR
jgi:hypothetical protein